jgi:hypothetical protein
MANENTNRIKNRIKNKTGRQKTDTPTRGDPEATHTIEQQQTETVTHPWMLSPYEPVGAAAAAAAGIAIAMLSRLPTRSAFPWCPDP